MVFLFCFVFPFGVVLSHSLCLLTSSPFLCALSGCCVEESAVGRARPNSSSVITSVLKRLSQGIFHWRPRGCWTLRCGQAHGLCKQKEKVCLSRGLQMPFPRTTSLGASTGLVNSSLLFHILITSGEGFLVTGCSFFCLTSCLLEGSIFVFRNVS